MEALKSPEEVALQAALVDRLRQEAPGSWKCIFLNCELRETRGGMSASGDLFAITKNLFGSPKREQWVLSADSLKIAFELGRLACSLADQPHVTVDLIISRDGSYKAFADFGPLRRLNGGDDFFRSKHRLYLEVEPLLKLID